MKVSKQSIRKKRDYSEDFRKRIVDDFESGKFSVKELTKLHGLAPNNIYRWIYKYSTFNKKGYRVVEVKDSSDKKLKELEKRIKELEGVVGRKQIMIDYLEQMMEVAKEELDIDIKKNFSTPPSGSSAKSKRK